MKVFAVLLLFGAAVTTASAQESNEIRCRGGGPGFAFDTVGARIASTGETILTMSLGFFDTSDWVLVEHLGDGRVTGGYWRLTPPSCAKVSDGDGSSYQPLRTTKAIRFETPANAQLKQRLHGSEVDTSPTAAERYADARSIQEYLRDPNHYWSFFIVSAITSGTPFFVASGHGFYKPPRAVLSPDDFKARKPSRVVTSVGEAGTTSTQEAVQTALSDRQNAQTLREQVTTQKDTRSSDPVKAVGRVKPSPGMALNPPPPICEAARRARARNSPAAPGLEATCAAQRAAEVSAVGSAGETITAFQPENTIKVRVTYRKELGYKGDTNAFGYVGPTSCNAFSVSVSVGDDSARQRNPIPINSDSKMEEAGGYYVCSYLVSEIPLDQTIRVGVRLSRLDLSAAWKGGDQAQPPAGQQRAIVDATRTITLNASQPRAGLSYEMVYAPVVPR